MRQTFGEAGWVRVDDPRYFDGTIYLRLSSDGRITDLYLHGDRDISPAALRSLPLRQYRAQALGRPDLLAMMLQAADPGIAERVAALFADSRDGQAPARRRRRILTPPNGRLDDDFLRAVAEAYRGAVAEGLSPNKTLAADVGHDNSRTVERWVYLARKAGHLPPTRQGEAR